MFLSDFLNKSQLINKNEVDMLEVVQVDKNVRLDELKTSADYLHLYLEFIRQVL